MTFDVRISEQADRDLREIYEYIAFFLRAPENAYAQLERLEEAIMKLEKMPDRFRRYEREPWLSRGLRVLPVDNYLVFYIPKSETRIVSVLRVMYSGRNLDAELDICTRWD